VQGVFFASLQHNFVEKKNSPMKRKIDSILPSNSGTYQILGFAAMLKAIAIWKGPDRTPKQSL
jgi:hypothetical protein